MTELTESGLCDLEERLFQIEFNGDWTRKLEIDQMERDTLVMALNEYRQSMNRKRETGK